VVFQARDSNSDSLVPDAAVKGVVNRSQPTIAGVLDDHMDLFQLARRDPPRRIDNAAVLDVGFQVTVRRDMARRRPSNMERMLDVHGVGQQKAAGFGQRFAACIDTYCRQHGLTIV
jgi:superfamily II DNA helicase RecQ